MEPYWENLLALHELFADSFRPEDIGKNTLTYPVYLAERKATGALLAYYQTAAGGSFESTVDAVKRFARADAARFRLRDALRSQALSSMIEKYGASFQQMTVVDYLPGFGVSKRLIRAELSVIL